MADNIPPAIPPQLTRRQALEKLTVHNNCVVTLDGQIAKDTNNINYVLVYDMANQNGGMLTCNTPEIKAAVKEFLKKIRDLHEAKCQEFLLAAAEAEKM